MGRSGLVALFVVSVLPAAAAEATYLGNEGFLIDAKIPALSE